MKRRRIKQIAIVVFGGLLAIAIVIAVCNILVVNNAKGRTFDNLSDVPTREIGLLLGTSPITPDGAHNYYFDNRMKAAADLYHAGKIRRILVSGGDYTMTEKHGCDEPTAMRDSLVAHNVPDTCIIEHWQGWRTINSIEAVKNLYDFDSITIISQKYHNERALYQADHFGLDAVGYNAEPSPIKSSRIRNAIREYMARVKLFIDLL
ncbi:ElyC/SanA/YdcF family protein [Duncaniella freteri]|uniref:SanA/YdcF family protein n=1 Tax=Duncaniella freteri TaxID=2530391 RepID=UPI0025B0D86E|nr:ElyC/SanA/YdcF family protein [uncultured Duncaniella sp.]